VAELTGGELVARVLKQAGVGHVFTLGGGHILPIYGGCLKESCPSLFSSPSLSSLAPMLGRSLR
jgi:hypothetical protein